MADVEEFRTQADDNLDSKLDEALKKIAPKKEEEEVSNETGQTDEANKETEEDTQEKDEEVVDPGEKDGEAEGGDEPKKEAEADETEDNELIELDEPDKIPKREINIESLNKLLETDFEDIDSLKRSFHDDELQKKYDDLLSNYKELKKQADPRQQFVNEEEYKRQLILKKYGQEVSPNFLSQLVSADFDKMGDVDILVLDKMMRTPNIQGGADGAREMVLHQLGISEDQVDDPSSWENLQKNLIADSAHKVRRALNEIKNIDVPETVDFDEQQKAKREAEEKKQGELREGWQAKTSDMVEGFNEYKMYRKNDKGEREEFFSFEVDKDFKKSIVNDVADFFTKSGLELTKENLQHAKTFMQDAFWKRYGNAMMQAHGKDVEARVREELTKKIDNPKDPNRKEAPEKDEQARQAEQLKDYLKDDGFSQGELIKF